MHRGSGHAAAARRLGWQPGTGSPPPGSDGGRHLVEGSRQLREHLFFEDVGGQAPAAGPGRRCRPSRPAVRAPLIAHSHAAGGGCPCEVVDVQEEGEGTTLALVFPQQARRTDLSGRRTRNVDGGGSAAVHYQWEAILPMPRLGQNGKPLTCRPPQQTELKFCCCCGWSYNRCMHSEQGADATDTRMHSRIMSGHGAQQAGERAGGGGGGSSGSAAMLHARTGTGKQAWRPPECRLTLSCHCRCPPVSTPAGGRTRCQPWRAAAGGSRLWTARAAQEPAAAWRVCGAARRCNRSRRPPGRRRHRKVAACQQRRPQVTPCVPPPPPRAGGSRTAGRCTCTAAAAASAGRTPAGAPAARRTPAGAGAGCTCTAGCTAGRCKPGGAGCRSCSAPGRCTGAAPAPAGRCRPAAGSTVPVAAGGPAEPAGEAGPGSAAAGQHGTELPQAVAGAGTASGTARKLAVPGTQRIEAEVGTALHPGTVRAAGSGRRSRHSAEAAAPPPPAPAAHGTAAAPPAPRAAAAAAAAARRRQGCQRE